MSKFVDLKGNKYNMLTVISMNGRDKYGKILWLCKCECGNETITHRKNRGHYNSAPYNNLYHQDLHYSIIII